jgi:dihydroorotate dehydrogenase (NAD+) catalytic subunit
MMATDASATDASATDASATDVAATGSASIDLAPNHKAGLTIANPVMPAAGCFGLGTEYSRLVEVDMLGAVIVGPITARSRRGAEPPRTLSIPGGVLLHTGLANRGAAAIVRRCARAWASSPIPVIAHVAGTTPNETASCCERLSGVDSVAGIELGLPDGLATSAEPIDFLDDAAAIIRAARATARHPLIVRLPLNWAGALCESAVDAGADALTVAAPPRGRMWHEPSGDFVTGRLYGSFVLPLALRALSRVAELVRVPLIGCGGIHSTKDALAFLRAGAVAIQVGGAIWRDPTCLARIACNLLSAVPPR